MDTPRDQCIEFEDVSGLRETGDAVLCDIEGEEIWIPKSQIHDDSEIWKSGQDGALVITRWIARKKGLV